MIKPRLRQQGTLPRRHLERRNQAHLPPQHLPLKHRLSPDGEYQSLLRWLAFRPEGLFQHSYATGLAFCQ